MLNKETEEPIPLLILSLKHPQSTAFVKSLANQGFTCTNIHSLTDLSQQSFSIQSPVVYIIDLAFSNQPSFASSMRETLNIKQAPVFYLCFDYSKTYDQWIQDKIHHSVIYYSTPIEITCGCIKHALNQNESEIQLEQRDKTNKSLATHSWWEGLMDHVIWNCPMPIAVFDSHLCFIYVSQTFLTDYDISHEKIIGKHHYEVFPQVPEKWKLIHARVLKGEILSNTNDFYVREDGTKIYTSWVSRPWFQANGSIGGIILYTSNITAQKNFARDLAVNEKKLRFLYQSLNQGIVYQDAQGNILGANPAAQRILGISEEELQTSSSLDPRWYMVTEAGDFVEGKDHPVMRALKHGEPIGPELRGLKTLTGEITWISISAIPINDPETDQIQEVYAVFEDLTAQKKQEETLKRQLEEKRIILAETQHRIKNNFASIEALLSLQAQQDIHSEAKDALQQAGSRVSNLRVLYERLLQSSEMRTVEMGSYLEDLARTLCDTINPSLSPVLELDCDQRVFGPTQAFPVGAIMVELMTNSLKYGFPFDKYEQNPTHRTPKIRVSFKRVGDSHHELRVDDNGLGFDVTNNNLHSNSFGLTLIRLMTEQLDGKLITTSTPDKGTTTTITF